MNELGMGEKRRWAIAAGGAAGVILALVWVFRSPLTMPLPAPRVAPKASVVLINPDSATAALTELAMLRDTTPLFLPTERNATVKELPPRESGKTFLDNDTLQLNFGDAGLNLAQTLPPNVTLNGKPTALAKPEDVLAADVSGQMLQGFDRKDSRISPVLARGGFVEVIATATGRQVLADSLVVDAAPPGNKEWQWLEFLAIVDAAGLVAPLKLIEGSRVEEVDAHFRDYLTQKFQIGSRLPPGFYRVIVGP